MYKLLACSDIFLLRCNSMRRSSIRAGDLVVVALESGWGIRKLTKLNEKVYLESDSKEMEVKEEYLVAGRVVTGSKI